MFSDLGFYIVTLSIFYMLLNVAKTDDEVKLAFHFDRIEVIDGVEQYFNYELDISKSDDSDTIFLINAQVEQLIELDDDWKADITVYRSDDADGEYTKFLKFPKMGICGFMKSIYKKYFYETIKDYSNLPHYDTCPLTKEKYWIKDYSFDADTFKQIAKPGYYRVTGFLLNEGEAKTGVDLFGSVTQI